jgi:exonuclease SbcD
MTFRIAHLSDIHAGYRTGQAMNAQGINLREADGYLALSKIISEIIEEKPDVVISAGDTFHTPKPDIRSIIFVQNQLRRLWRANIPVYLLAGNHDTNDIRADIASSRVLHDPWRHIYSHVEPYVHYEIGDGIHLHLVSHHMYSEQASTMDLVKPIPGEINIFSTHGSVIDPIMEQKLHTEQSPREIVIPDFLLKDRDWSYTLLGHIHERGFVGSKDKIHDTSLSKIYYNGSLIRRGFSDKWTPLGRGWTMWTIDEEGVFTPEFHKVAQRPQKDFKPIDAENLTSSEVSERIIANLQETQTNGNKFIAATAPILRQGIFNITPAKYAALDWKHISDNSKHALTWGIKQSVINPTEVTPDSIDNDTQNDSGDMVKLFDNWVDKSAALESTEESLRDNVKEQARNFVKLGQEVTLDAE